jgi:hypothetical protein
MLMLLLLLAAAAGEVLPRLCRATALLLRRAGRSASRRTSYDANSFKLSARAVSH